LLAAAAFVPNRFSRVLGRRFPGLMDMTKASVASALVALAVNDSGVVAASTLLLWPALTVLSVAPETLAAGLEPPCQTERETVGFNRNLSICWGSRTVKEACLVAKEVTDQT